jgi:predicted DNA-binding ribbon-helix-helix protein
MKSSSVLKRSVVVAGHKTSVSLEEAFWDGLREISGSQKMTVSDLVSEIANNRPESNLSSVIRLFVLSHFKSRAELGAVSSHAGEFDGIKPPSRDIAELRHSATPG